MSRTYDNGPILSGDQVRVSTQPRVIAEKHQHHAKPTVTFKREGDVIREIHIQCGCGEEIVLECDYAGSVATQPARPPVKPMMTR